MPRVPLTEKTDRLVGSTVSAPLYGGVGRDVAAATTVVAVGAGAEGLFVGTGWELGVGLVGMAWWEGRRRRWWGDGGHGCCCGGGVCVCVRCVVLIVMCVVIGIAR